jgi:hypothetical protein
MLVWVGHGTAQNAAFQNIAGLFKRFSHVEFDSQKVRMIAFLFAIGYFHLLPSQGM